MKSTQGGGEKDVKKTKSRERRNVNYFPGFEIIQKLTMDILFQSANRNSFPRNPGFILLKQN
ncbi:hypothetical protein LEP1GSC188_1615 [Leptospira weilii serovar Topaz str. LT2116]|uniref:Uncharacterized protein n=1 Tax=Leptospira weilii serovar Topaz str. LT2116 TaxID=1088540 RepID=M3GRY2_9LEPT|nr:hypothetical protein LEP1GSC188_1615 [Leptospira weilii serovar Topaz str. LT2116]